MLTEDTRKGIYVSLCICFCCGVIFGIPAIVYYYDSFLDVKHECEVYYLYTRICRYACGTYCSRRMYSSSSSHTHCHTRYCWGMEYVYEWKTMDWRYTPYKVDTGFVESPWINMTNENEIKLKKLLSIINHEDEREIELSEEQVLNLDLHKYLLQDKDAYDFLYEQTITTLTPNEFPSTTIDKYNVEWCDWKHPAYYTYGSCSSWPYQWYTYGDKPTCYTDNKCSWFSSFSPNTNWDISKGLGFTSLSCFGIFNLVLFYFIFALLYDKLCGYSQYEWIYDTKSVDIKDDNDYDYDNDNVVCDDDIINDDILVINPLVNNDTYNVTDNNYDINIDYNNPNDMELLQETEGGIDIANDNYTIQ